MGGEAVFYVRKAYMYETLIAISSSVLYIAYVACRMHTL
jgi:hypothetical protein